MDILIEEILGILDSEISSITSDILSITGPIENVKSQRLVRDRLLSVRTKIKKAYDKSRDIERGFKWE